MKKIHPEILTKIKNDHHSLKLYLILKFVIHSQQNIVAYEKIFPRYIFPQFI
jgi:hypothetical protein